MEKILIVEDDNTLSALMAEILACSDFSIEIAEDGEKALHMSLNQDYDLILLDVMLPNLNGFELLKVLRQTKQTPVMILSQRCDEVDRVVGLEIGADDYLAKPFNHRELVARVKAILRRSQLATKLSIQETLIKHGDIQIDASRQEALCDDKPLTLTNTEFALLSCLLRKPGSVLTKESLSEEVLGKELMPFDRSLDMHMSNLRKKLPQRSDARPRIKTVRGKGYIWVN